MFYEHLKGPMEAMLFAAGDPLKTERLSELLDIPLDHVLEMLRELQADMDRPERGLCLLQVAGGWQMCAKPELAPVVEKLAVHQDAKLSQMFFFFLFLYCNLPLVDSIHTSVVFRNAIIL